MVHHSCQNQQFIFFFPRQVKPPSSRLVVASGPWVMRRTPWDGRFLGRSFFRHQSFGGTHILTCPHTYIMCVYCIYIYIYICIGILDLHCKYNNVLLMKLDGLFLPKKRIQDMSSSSEAPPRPSPGHFVRPTRLEMRPHWLSDPHCDVSTPAPFVKKTMVLVIWWAKTQEFWGDSVVTMGFAWQRLLARPL